MFKDLLTPETFEFFARYLLAGYVVIFVRSAFVAGLRPKPTELLIEAVILSLIAQLLLYPVEWIHSALALSESAKAVLPTWFVSPSSELKLVIRVLIVPALLGCTLGYFLTSDVRSGLLRRLSLPVVHPVRKAHDFAFGGEREASFVEITFEDGTKIGGWYGNSSLASTDDERSDLYLERTYAIDDDGNWTEQTPARSILIKLQNVRSIEFLANEEN